MVRKLIAGSLIALLGAVEAAWQPGCTPTVVRNLTAERTGNINVLVINDTPYRATFSFGTYDAWDRNPPGSIDFKQTRLEAHASTGSVALTCARNLAIGTQGLYQRALDRDQTSVSGFDPDAFDTVVHFSDAASDSTLAGVATVGTAAGVEKLLGIDYTCEDQVIFTLVQDPAAPGGFRIDFVDVVDQMVH